MATPTGRAGITTEAGKRLSLGRFREELPQDLPSFAALVDCAVSYAACVSKPRRT